MVRSGGDEPHFQWMILGCAGLASLLVAVGVFQVILFVGGSGSPPSISDGISVLPLEGYGKRGEKSCRTGHVTLCWPKLAAFAFLHYLGRHVLR